MLDILYIIVTLMFMVFMQVTIPYMDAMGMLITFFYSQNVNYSTSRVKKNQATPVIFSEQTCNACRGSGSWIGGRYTSRYPPPRVQGLGIFGYLELRHLRADDVAATAVTRFFHASLGGLEFHSVEAFGDVCEKPMFLFGSMVV